jgi:hypothetical protein
MKADTGTLRDLIGRELASLPDERIVRHIHAHLVEPAPELRDWVTVNPASNTPVGSCLDTPPRTLVSHFASRGLGLVAPGATWIGGEGNPLSIGQDSGWYENFLETYFNSFAVCELPIWRVFKKGESGQRTPISDEGTWDETWVQVLALRERNPDGYYDCASDVSVRYLYE